MIHVKKWQPAVTLNLLESSADAVVPTRQMLFVKREKNAEETSGVI